MFNNIHFPAVDDAVLPADYLNIIDQLEALQNGPACLLCYRPKTVEETFYCSRRCAVAHTLLKLTGGKLAQEDVDYMNDYATFLSIDSEGVDIRPSKEVFEPALEAEEKNLPPTPVATRKPVARNASSRLIKRLEELGKLDDDLTIGGLIETLEGDDNFDESEEDSPLSVINLDFVDVPLNNETQFAESSIEEAVENGNVAGVEENTETEHIVKGDVEMKTFKSIAESPDDAELEDLSHLGLASRLRILYTRNKNKTRAVPKRGGESEDGARPGRWPPTPEIPGFSPPRPQSPALIPEPSGDQWDDFLHIQRFLEKSGLGGSAEVRSW